MIRLGTGGAFCLSLGVALLMAASCKIEGPSDDDDGGGGSSSSGPGPTELCQEQCAAQDPAGQEAFVALRSCLLCGACADICKGKDGGVCVNGSAEAPANCSAQFQDCASCVASDCALRQKPEDLTYEGVCFEYGNACSADPVCVGFNNCVTQCLASGVGGSGGAGGTSSAGGAGGSM